MNALPPSRTAVLTIAAVLVGTAPRAAAHPYLGSVTGRLVDQIVAGADRLFVLAGGEVRTLDAAGRDLGRCAAFAAPRHAERQPLLGAPDAEEVLSAAGLPDDDSTTAAEEALEEEGLGRHPRGLALPDTGVVPRMLAAGAENVWIATSSGLFRGDETGCRSVGLDGRDVLLVAAGRGAVMAATEDLLFRRTIDDPSPAGQGDDSFTVIAGLAERPRALAVDAAGAALVADDAGVEVVGGDGKVERILDRPTDALAVCSGEAVALADDGVYRWTPGGAPVRTGDRPPIRTLGCGPSPEVRWIATGLGVWTSADAASWTERTETLGRRVAGAATLGPSTWLAIDDQVSAVDLRAQTEDDTTGAPHRPATVAGAAALSTRHLVAPTLPWPWVTALLGAEQRTPNRRRWEVMLLVTFPLGRSRNGQGNAAALAAERVRRDEALAREEAELEADPSGDAETDARLEALRQEREALR